MPETWRIDWIRIKSEFAARLAEGCCGGSYGDAALILCSCLSALAADVWPGERIDRKRFVELLTRYTPPRLVATRISLLLLVQHLRDLHMPEAAQIDSAFLQHFPAGEVLIGDQVDKDESDILPACRSISISQIRKSSYADILYREVRSAYMHEGKPGDAAQGWAQTGHPTAGVSYVNTIGQPRRIHFHIGWISELAQSAAEAVNQMAAPPPLAHPSIWWVDG